MPHLHSVNAAFAAGVFPVGIKQRGCVKIGATVGTTPCGRPKEQTTTDWNATHRGGPEKRNHPKDADYDRTFFSRYFAAKKLCLV